MRNTLGKRRQPLTGAQLKVFARGAVVLALALMCGCSSGASSANPGAAPRQARSSASAAATIAATVPSLVFADPIGIPPTVDAQPVVGSRPAPSTYKTFLTGDHVASVTWQTVDMNGTTQTVLVIGLDKQGTDVLASWSKAHVGGNLLLLVGGRALSMPALAEPITNGSLELSARDVEAMRRLLDPAVVRTK